MSKSLYGLVIFIVCLSFTSVAMALTPEENLEASIIQSDPYLSYFLE